MKSIGLKLMKWEQNSWVLFYCRHTVWIWKCTRTHVGKRLVNSQSSKIENDFLAIKIGQNRDFWGSDFGTELTKEKCQNRASFSLIDLAACKGASELISTPVAGRRRVLNGCAVFGAWLGRKCGQNAFFQRKKVKMFQHCNMVSFLQ